ncbi:acetyltransferase [Butyrivibrio sp. MC2013]|uniref:acetyltransferase n=1 Tax=Butyrivibrio sp. MC2013 TaxID=1280686 RepID=UPI00041405AB|nr:acetyltransferase [Butyrivibrio sp. MC2013]
MSKGFAKDSAYGKELVIVGTGDFAAIVYQMIQRNNGAVRAFCVDDEYYDPKAPLFMGERVIPTSRMIEICPQGECGAVLGFIGSPMFDIRREKFSHLLEMGYEFPNIIDCDTDYLEEIGHGNIIMQNVSIGYDSHIGDCNIVWPGAVFPHNNHIGSFSNIAPNATFCGYASIGDHCYIGAGSVLKNRITVADRTFVGAAAYVRHDTESGQTIVPPRSYILER